MQNRSTLFIDTLCFLAADKTGTPEAVTSFLVRYAEEKINLNQRGSKGLRPVEETAISGNATMLRFLIEVCGVDISADEDTPNLVERASANPKAREYLLNTNDKLWQRFNDGTTDFLAHVMAGRLGAAEILVESNPQLIFDKNIRFQNAFHWCHLLKINAAWLHASAESYFQQNLLQGRWADLARYHGCMGHFNRLQLPNRPNVAFIQYDLSVEYFRKALQNCSRQQEAYQLTIELATALLFCGRMHLQMRVGNSDAAAHSIATSEICLNKAIKIMRSLPKESLSSNRYLFDSLLREHAENCFLLDDICYAIGDSLSFHLLDAIEFYKKSISYGEEAVRSADEIGKKSAKDSATMVKYCDKLCMSYSAMVTCHQTLAERNLQSNKENTHDTETERQKKNNASEKFHRDECERYQQLGKTLLNRPDSEPPSQFLPARLTSKLLVQPVNGYSNGLLRSPSGQIGIFRLNTSPKLQCVTTRSGDDIPELFLPTSLSALTT